MKTPTTNDIANAIQNRQESIKINGKVVKLPTPQTAGTETQKRYYAELKAREILASN